MTGDEKDARIIAEREWADKCLRLRERAEKAEATVKKLTGEWVEVGHRCPQCGLGNYKLAEAERERDEARTLLAKMHNVKVFRERDEALTLLREVGPSVEVDIDWLNRVDALLAQTGEKA